MPFKPKKCWGKKVILTPTNIVAKCTLSHEELSVKPVKRGNQCTMPAKIPKTAPIDKT